MNLRKLIPALCVAGALMGAAAPAGAYPYGGPDYGRGHHNGWGHDRGGWGHDRGWNNGYYRSGWHGDRGWHRGWRERCWVEWRHHHRVRVCR